MDRDDQILHGLAKGATSTATLAASTGLSGSSVGRGLRRLIECGQVFSPVRGRYRLTAAGEALLGPADGEPAGTLEHSAETMDDQGPDVPESRAAPHAGQRPGTAPADPLARQFDWPAVALGVVLALGGVSLVRLLMAILGTHTAVRPPSAPPARPPQPAAPPPVWPGMGPAW